MKTRFTQFTFFITCASVVFFFGSSSINYLKNKSNDPDAKMKYDKPREVAKFLYDQRAYPFGTIPDNWYEKAVDHIRNMHVPSFAKSLDRWGWIPMGPTNVAGRIRAIVVDPVNPSIIYIGSAGGGIWKSTNEGVTWRAVSDFLPNLRINCLTMHPTNNNILLAGNGEGSVIWQGGYMFGRGIYRTDDAGENWYIIPSTNIAAFQYVYDVAFDPFNPTTILAATSNGVYRSSDDGVTWSRKLPFSAAKALQVCFSKTVSGTVYSPLWGGAIYKSTDSGIKWTNITTGKITGATNYNHIQIGVAPSNSDIVMASYIDQTTEECIGMYKTTDGGNSWNKISTPTNESTGDSYVGAQGTFNNVIVFYPTDPNIVYAGGIDIYRTNNGGNQWSRLTDAYTHSGKPPVHPDQHAIAFNPSNLKIMYFGHDGGIDRTTTGGAGFEARTSGLTITQFQSVSMHPTSDKAFGGTIDNGNLMATSGTTFKDVTGGDGGFTIIDPQNPNYVYAEIYFLTFYRSTSGGANNTFQKMMNGIPMAAPSNDQYPGTSDRVNFFAPFEIDPNNSATLYAGTYRLYKTTDHADSWTPITGDLTRGMGALSIISVAKSDSKIIYVGSSDGNVAVTKDGGSTWSSVRNGLPNRYVTDLEIDKNDPSSVYVSVSGFGGGHVFHTTNSGATWTDVSGSGTNGLPDMPVNAVIIYPTNSKKIIVGTDLGAFETNDSAATWYPITAGMGNVTVSDLKLRPDGTLFAATHGRGIFRSSYSLLDTQNLSQPIDFRLEQNFPNPFNPGTFIRYQIGTQTNVTINVYDVRGRLVQTLIEGEHQPGNYTVEFNGNGFASGMYMYRMTANGRSENKMMMMIK